MRIFGSVQQQSESTSPFLNIIIFQKMVIFGAHYLHYGEDRHMRSLTFLYRIQYSTTFIWSFFGYNVYFQQHPAPKWIYFHTFEHYNISKNGYLWSPQDPLWREIDICTHWLFCTEFKKSQSIIFVINRKITYNNINSVLYIRTTTPEVANHIFLWHHFYLHSPHCRCLFALIKHTLVT